MCDERGDAGSACDEKPAAQARRDTQITLHSERSAGTGQRRVMWSRVCPCFLGESL